METPGRKAAEPSSAAASTHSLSRSSKRPRFLAASSSSSSSSLSPVPPRSHRSLRLMESAIESSGSKKGKEKEKDSELRLKIRDKQRSLGLSIDSGDVVGRDDRDDDEEEEDDDDDDGEGNFGILHQNLTSASSALQGLLRKLGAGLDELLPSSAVAATPGSGRLKKILSSLREEGEEGRKIEALTQLCDLLLMGTEDSLCAFPVDSFVPVLVELLNYESNADIMLLAARAITHLCDVLPSSCSAVLHYGAVRCFCAKLLEIECMDLAEQSLQALKKISQEQPTACLRAGALMAVLSFLDFFPTGVQRVALSTAANMCKKLPPDAIDFVMEAVPLLTNLLQYQDSKVLEHSSVCLTRIVEAIASSPNKLDELCHHGLVEQVASLISTSNSGGVQASLSISTYTGLIRLLSICAKGSPLGAKTLLVLGISSILKDILPGSCLVGSISVPPALTRPPDQIFEIVNLADELLPPLPEGTISHPNCSSFQMKSFDGEKFPSTSSGKENINGSMPEISAREKLLCEQPELLQQFGVDLLPVLVQIYGSTVNVQVRNKCLSVIGKLMHFCTADMILTLLNSTNISSFLAGVLACKDPQVLITGLQMAEILMEKLPKAFSKMFVREGVLHAIDLLISHDSQNVGGVQILPAERSNDSISETSFRSRCYRRGMSYSNPDGSFLEEAKAYVSANNCPSAASAEIPSRNSKGLSVSTCAKVFKDKYFPSGPGEAGVGATDELLRLKDLCVKLNLSVDDQHIKTKGKAKATGPNFIDPSASKEEYLIEVISSILAELSRGDSVSTFEFIGSGVVAALLNYFSCGTFSRVRVSEANLSKLRQQAFKRFKLFIAVAFPSSNKEGDETPMIVLIRKLQNALSSLERFPVVLSHSSRSSCGNARFSSGLSALSQPFKLHLRRAQGDKSLRDYSSNIVLIDPLASLSAVEEFLWPRVMRGESGQKKGPAFGENLESVTPPSETGTSSLSSSNPASVYHHSTRPKSSVAVGGTSVEDDPHGRSRSSWKGKGKTLQESAQDEERGPLTRNTTCRGAASDKDGTMTPAHMDSTPEDQEADISPVEIDDALVIEEDDLSDDEDDAHEDVLRNDDPFCTPEKVHDVKLADSAEDGMGASAANESPSRPRSGSNNAVNSMNAFSSKGAMSIAASVAIGGLVSPNSGGFRSCKDKQGVTMTGSKNDPPKLIFSSGGKLLNRNMTIYQAVRRQVVLDEDDDERYGNEFLSNDGSRLWRNIYTITYQRADNPVNRTSTGSLNSTLSKISESDCSNTNLGFQLNHISLLDNIFQWELPCDLEKTNPTYNILALLRVLECLNQNIPRLRAQAVCDDFSEGKILCLDEMSAAHIEVPPEKFINSKLTPKLCRQIQDALALCGGSLPTWCYQLTKACPFLFPFETRRQYFYSTAFGLSRALNWLQQQQGTDGQGSANEREVRLGRLQRQKVRVSRNRILDSARKVMEMYSSQKAVLEVEYFGEVGTGLGPTLEFYTLLSHDLQKVELGMWRSSSTSENSFMDIDDQPNRKSDHFSDGKDRVPGSAREVELLVQAPLGLFPRPWPPGSDASEGSQFAKVIEYFHLVGQVMAKALQDGRLLDLPLSMAFYKLVLGQELDLHDILSFDAELGKILQELQVLVCRKQYLDGMSGNGCGAVGGLCYRDAPIEDLCLDFTLPGYPDYILKPGYDNVLVDSDNLDEYISLVVDATVKTGLMHQMEAFREGFNQVFDISSLQIFSPHELDYLLCGRRELWKMEMLVDHIKFDHGYTAKSPVIINLLEIMGEFTSEQQHAFCQFITGAPRLPPGGLAMLNPKLTIVRKHSSTANPATSMMVPPESADEDLPSVMTCANYLKLPPYSTKEIMYKKLLYAINEGQGSFDLS